MSLPKYRKIPATNDSDDEDPINNYVSPRDAHRFAMQNADRNLVSVASSARSNPDSVVEILAHASLSSVSVTLQNLSSEERTFIVLVEEGNVENVRKFLDEHPTVNLNGCDIHGVSALTRAVRNENKDMVNFLVSLSNLAIGDTILHAVQLANTDIVTILSESLRNRGLEFKPVQMLQGDDSAFSPDMTPLMLAAHENDYNMVKLLHGRGHSLHRPHEPDCKCELPQCSGKKGIAVGKLQHSKQRFNAYKADCSPAFISLTCSDVIKRAFIRSRELIGCSKKEPEIAEKYLDLAEKLNEFAKALLEECNKAEEVELLLKQDHAKAPIGAAYPRLYLGIACKQRNFIAHENCQTVLQTAYLDNWQDWRAMSTLAKLIRVMIRVTLFPFFAIAYVALPAPVTFIENWMRPPIHRHMLSTVSYIVFLGLVFLETAHDSDKGYRGAPRSGLEIPIVIFVVSHGWEIMTRSQAHGSVFWSNWWNLYDVVNLIIFVATFAMWISACRVAAASPELDRMEWEWNEPAMIAESLFGFATILSFGKLLQIFRADRMMGPLLISLGKMAVELVKFFVVYAVLILSFATGLNHMYETYADQVRVNSDGTNTTQHGAFMTFRSTTAALFWTLFGMTPLEAPAIIIGNRFENGSVWENYTYREHTFTETSGYIMFGLYIIVAVLVLLNTLIAVMSDAFSKVTENRDTEWKFARTQIWVGYFDVGYTLPPPFNILPTVKSIVGLIKRTLSRDEIDFEKGKDRRAMRANHAALQKKLVKNYFAKIEKDKDTDRIAEIQKSLQKITQQLQDR